MKKIAKLSLVAAVAVAGFTTSAMADTLAEAFAASKVKGEIKSQYFQKETTAATNSKSSIWANGGNLSLTTGSFYGLTAGVTFQTSHVTSLDDVAGNYAGTMDASGSVMSEAYLAYTLANTTAKVGRQYITTPLVAGSGSRMIKQSFEGIVLVNTDLADTTLVAAYADKFQARTDNNGGVGEFNQFKDGAYTVYAKNTSVDNLALQAQYALVNDDSTTTDAKALYLDAAYNLGNVTVAGQTYQTTDYSDADAALYGVKVIGNIEGIKLTAAYTTNGDNASVVPGVGSGADGSFTASPIIGGKYTGNTDAYLVGLGYKFNMGLGLDASYTNWDDDAMTDTYSETNVTASYAYNKNLSTKIMYSSFDNYSDDYASRVYVSYTF